MSEQILEKNSISELGESAPEAIARKPSVAMVIGSSGVKAFASLPFMQRLRDLDIGVDLILGCGGGGLLGALWSAGYNLDQIAKFFTTYFTKDAFNQVDTESMIQISNNDTGAYSIASGLYKNIGLHKAYNVIFKDMQLEDLKPKTILYTTDIATGDGVALEKGRIADAVEACSSLYPIMPPVKIGDRYLADGSFLAPLPIIEAVKRNIDIILVVYLQDQLDPNPKNFLESCLNVARIHNTALQRSQIFGCIDLHHFEILIAEVQVKKTIHPWQVDSIPEILLAGKEAAYERVPELLKMKTNFERRASQQQSLKDEKKKEALAKLNNPSLHAAQDAYSKFNEDKKETKKVWNI